MKNFAYSIKAMLPKHKELNDKELIFKSDHSKNDNVLFFKDGFKSEHEAKQNSILNSKPFNTLSPLMITFYSIGDKL